MFFVSIVSHTFACCQWTALIAIYHHPLSYHCPQCSSDLLRYEIAAAGFDEILTLALCSIDENYTYLRHKYKLGDAVVLANPQSDEFQVQHLCATLCLLCRTSRDAEWFMFSC